eukprot:scaffold284809_cov37-Tisochrysis_lutea.AAC.2
MVSTESLLCNDPPVASSHMLVCPPVPSSMEWRRGDCTELVLEMEWRRMGLGVLGLDLCCMSREQPPEAPCVCASYRFSFSLAPYGRWMMSWSISRCKRPSSNDDQGEEKCPTALRSRSCWHSWPVLPCMSMKVEAHVSSMASIGSCFDICPSQRRRAGPPGGSHDKQQLLNPARVGDRSLGCRTEVVVQIAKDEEREDGDRHRALSAAEQLLAQAVPPLWRKMAASVRESERVVVKGKGAEGAARVGTGTHFAHWAERGALRQRGTRRPWQIRHG